MQHLIPRMQPNLRGNNCTLTKPRCAGQVRLSFSRPTRVVAVWNNLPSDTTDFSFAQVSCISYYALFAEILYSLFWLMPPRFQRFRSVRIASSMLIVSVTVLATCKWLLALCCSVNLIWRRGEAQACTCNKQSHYKVRLQRCGDCGVLWTEIALCERLLFTSTVGWKTPKKCPLRYGWTLRKNVILTPLIWKDWERFCGFRGQQRK